MGNLHYDHSKKITPTFLMFSVLVASLLDLQHGRYIAAHYIYLTTMPIKSRMYMLM